MSAGMSVGSDSGGTMPRGFAYPLGGRLLVSMPRVGALAVLGSRAAARLAAGAGLEQVLAGGAVDLPADPGPAPGPGAGPLAPEKLGLVLTRRCNMACSYCEHLEPGASCDPAADMPLEIARAAVEAMAGLLRQAGRRRLQVHLFGGEPVLAWELLREVVEVTRVVAAEAGLEPFFELTTNGLCSETRARWIGDNLHHVVLSLDGPPAVQARSRPASASARAGAASSSEPVGAPEVVERSAAILGRATAELSLRMCVDRSSAGCLETSLAYLLDRFRPQRIAVEPVRMLGGEQPAGRSAAPDPVSFVRGVARGLELAEAHGVELIFSGADIGEPVASACPVGRDGLIVHPTGLVAACYLPPSRWQAHGLDLAFGEVGAATGLQIDTCHLEQVRGLAFQTATVCDRCFCRWHCAGGCHVRRAALAPAGVDQQWCLIARALSLWQLLRLAGETAEAEALLEDPSRHREMAALPAGLS